MKLWGTVALTLIIGVTCVYGQQRSVNVKMRFSGTGGASPIDLRYANASRTEEDVAGSGSLGQFTFRSVRSSSDTPQASGSCSTVFFPSISGAAVLRFQDGSLLKVKVKDGGDCIDFINLVAVCTLTYEVTGGTGRFEGATGELTYEETGRPVLSDAFGIPVFFTETGQITGSISGVGGQTQSPD